MTKKKKLLKNPKTRGTWAINPKTRVKPSRKVYSRKRNSSKNGWPED